MDREKIAFAAMKPLDLALGGALRALKATGTMSTLGDTIYAGAKKVLGGMYEKQNDLRAEGLANVPATGGVLFAVNHQSWNDVQVVAATAPRRLRFLAKAEFETWPILRHLIELSDSPFIRRGGDAEGMAQAAEWLRDGKALVIFPEGTIPGEEDLGRHEVEPDTGLLRGHTGAVRLAIAAGVPIIPVGVSGTGASFPPEVYPRLELLEAPKPVPVTVRFGKPISFAAYRGQELDRDQLRRLTKELMLAISALVDHDRNYIPIEVPIEPLPRYERLGVLLLHGFTSSVRTVDGLVPLLEQAGLPYRVPVLRGHGTRFEDLAGVTADDWVADADKALRELAPEVDRIAVVGLSMGGLVALNLAMQHNETIAAVVTWAAALRFKDPLAFATPYLAKVVKTWPSPESFNDRSLKTNCENYPRFMTEAFASLYDFARTTEARLGEVRAPLCVLQSKKDQVVAPVSANIIYRDVASTHREIHWFTKSGHEMGQDLERQGVFETTMRYLAKLRA